MSYYILGIDPGSKVTGFGVIKKTNNQFEFIDCGVIKIKADDKPTLFFDLYHQIDQLLDQYPITQVSCESQFVMKNAQSAMMISNAKTCVYIACGKRKIPVFEYPPKKAKIAVAGNGAAEKIAVQKMIRLHLNIMDLPLELDASDALALALCHAFQLKPVQVRK